MERGFIRNLNVDGIHSARKWTDEILAGALVALDEAGESINAGYLNIHHNALYQGISNYPGGWKFLVYEAGFDPEEVVSKRRPGRWKNKYQ